MEGRSIHLGYDDDETLLHLFVWALGRLDSRLNYQKDDAEEFALKLARTKVARLREKLYPTKKETK